MHLNIRRSWSIGRGWGGEGCCAYILKRDNIHGYKVPSKIHLENCFECITMATQKTQAIVYMKICLYGCFLCTKNIHKMCGVTSFLHIIISFRLHNVMTLMKHAWSFLHCIGVKTMSYHTLLALYLKRWNQTHPTLQVHATMYLNVNLHHVSPKNYIVLQRGILSPFNSSPKPTISPWNPKGDPMRVLQLGFYISFIFWKMTNMAPISWRVVHMSWF